MDAHRISVAAAVPLVGRLRRYSARLARADVVAGFVVAVTLLPQGLAYGGLAGLSPVAGLYTALGAATVFALVTSTRLVAMGPSATLAVITFTVVQDRAGGDAGRAASLAAALSLLTGMWCLLAAVLRVHGIADFLSAPVMLGYQLGVGVEIIAEQVGPLLGVPASHPDALVNLWQVLTGLDRVKALTAVVSLVALCALVLLGRYLPGVPAGLAVCLAAIAVSAAADLAGHGVAVVGEVSGGPPDLAWPDVTTEDVWALLPVAAGMALIASIETTDAVRQTVTDTGERVSLVREGAALGAASMASGALGGFPPTADGSHTLTAGRAGAHSQLFQLVTAGLVLFVLFTGGPLLARLPTAVLAAIIVVGVPQLIDVTSFLRLWRCWRAESVIALVTVAGVLIFGVLRGLLIAAIISVGQLVRRVARPHDAVLTVTDDDQEPREIAEAMSPHPDILVYRVDAPLFFANAQRLWQRVITLVTVREPYPRCVILDAGSVFYLDATAAEALARLVVDLRALGCGLVLADVSEPILAVLRANPYCDGATRRLPAFPTVGDAFTAVREP